MISNSDVLVVLDSVQYTKNDWRNRNQLCGPNGLFWLSVPIRRASTRGSIYEARVTDSQWISNHLTSIRQTLSGLNFADRVLDSVEPVYDSLKSCSFLHSINLALIRNICDLVSITTPILLDGDIKTPAQLLDDVDPTLRLIEICRELKADSYLTGPRGFDYLDLSSFRRAGIKIEVADYSRLSPYRQKFRGFVPNVSVLDFIASVGPESAADFFGTVDIVSD